MIVVPVYSTLDVVNTIRMVEIAKEADVLILLCDQNASTVNMINKEFLSKMKKSSVLINCARVSRARRFSHTPRRSCRLRAGRKARQRE